MSPAFNYKDAVKAAIIFKNLPKLRDEVIQLRKEVKVINRKHISVIKVKYGYG